MTEIYAKFMFITLCSNFVQCSVWKFDKYNEHNLLWLINQLLIILVNWSYNECTKNKHSDKRGHMKYRVKNVLMLRYDPREDTWYDLHINFYCVGYKLQK